MGLGKGEENIDSPDRPAVEVYGDESLCRGGLDLVGMIHMSQDAAAEIRQRIDELREEHGFLARRGEFKWVKSSGQTPLPVYLGLVDLICEQLGLGALSFRSIVISGRIQNRLHKAVSRDLGFYNAWQVLLQPFLAEGHLVRVYLDRRTDRESESLTDLRDELNQFGRECAGLSRDCCEVVEARDSRDEDLIQVVDLLLGAVGFHLAGGHVKPGASPAKVELARRIARGICLTDLSYSSECFRVDRWP